jgi:hypothetical protein
MTDDPCDPQGDPFGPPAVPTEVACLHCGEQYDSYLIEWRIETGADGKQHGFWCCPTPGCSGRGFGFDIFSTDPAYQDERGGWCYTDDEESDEDESDEDDFDEHPDGDDSLPDGLPGSSEPGNNGHDRLKPNGDADDEIPF